MNCLQATLTPNSLFSPTSLPIRWQQRGHRAFREDVGGAQHVTSGHCCRIPAWAWVPQETAGAHFAWLKTISDLLPVRHWLPMCCAVHALSPPVMGTGSRARCGHHHHIHQHSLAKEILWWSTLTLFDRCLFERSFSSSWSVLQHHKAAACCRHSFQREEINIP